jgi:hypothetical protein
MVGARLAAAEKLSAMQPIQPGSFTAASYRGSALTTVGVQPDVSGVNPGPNRGFTSTFNRQSSHCS